MKCILCQSEMTLVEKLFYCWDCKVRGFFNGNEFIFKSFKIRITKEIFDLARLRKIKINKSNYVVDGDLNDYIKKGQKGK